MKTVPQMFNEFESRLTTTQQESDAAKGHRASIEACLHSAFGLEEFFQSGSFGNGTNIPLHSDVDRFAIFPNYTLPDNSLLALRKVRAALVRRFRTTPIKVRRPALVMDFGPQGAEVTEIIPAFKDDVVGEFSVYRIPDPSSAGWILSAPKLIRAYINEINVECDGRLKALIRFLKAWKANKKVPIQSIYLELACADFVRKDGLLATEFDLPRFLQGLSAKGLPSINLPSGIGATIEATSLKSQTEEVQKKVRTAGKIATLGATATLELNSVKASYHWKHLFGRGFPNRPVA